MATPIARFSFSNNYLVVAFSDTSLNSPTSWLWDLGDGSASVITQNLSHTYTTPGIYRVVLQATNSDGSDSYTFDVVVSDVNIVPFTIAQLVAMGIPSGITIPPDYLKAQVAKWQTLLGAPNSINVPAPDTYDETKWPALANVLIANLVIYDYIISLTNNSIISGNTSSGSTSAISEVKQIKTGPTEVEYFSSNQALSDFLKASDFFTMSKGNICGIADALGIYLNMCPARKNSVPFIVIKKETAIAQWVWPYNCS
jgi:PKD repeat protein